MTTDYDRLLLDAVGLARRAGALQIESFRKGHLEVHAKLNESDIVTRVDAACDALITGYISSHYPDHSILAEESGSDERGAEYLWVIDPLDGTTNYAAGLPVFAVSIGIKYRGQTVVGVVYAPYLDELYTAVRGRGAFFNGEPIRVSGKDRLDRAVLATGFPVDRNVNPDDNTSEFRRVLSGARAVRCNGAASMDLCYTASGVMDGFWEMNLHEWDVCAGLLIVKEAGGEWSHYRCDRNVAVVAGTPAIHNLILPLIRTDQ